MKKQDLFAGISVEGSDDIIWNPTGKLPRMVERVRAELEKLDAGTLLLTRRLSERLQVSYSAILSHACHPGLQEYCIFDSSRNRKLWGNKKVIANLKKNLAK